jgi:hypothetical protein
MCELPVILKDLKLENMPVTMLSADPRIVKSSLILDILIETLI